MEIPKTLKIGSHFYKVVCPYEFKERGDVDGQHDKQLLEIRIDDRDSWSHKQKPDSRIRQIIVHEIIHAIDSASGLGRLNGNVKEEEQIVESLSEGLCQVFSDNKSLIKLFE